MDIHNIPIWAFILVGFVAQMIAGALAWHKVSVPPPFSGLPRYTFEEFIAEPERYGSAERFLLGDFEALRRAFAAFL